MKITIEKQDGTRKVYTFGLRKQRQYEGEGVILSLKEGSGVLDRCICYDAANNYVAQKDKMPEMGDTLELDGEQWVYEEKMSRQYWDELKAQGCKVIAKV
jgi:hypothetical protein